MTRCLKPEAHTTYADAIQQRPNQVVPVRTPQGGKGDGLLDQGTHLDAALDAFQRAEIDADLAAFESAVRESYAPLVAAAREMAKLTWVEGQGGSGDWFCPWCNTACGPPCEAFALRVAVAALEQVEEAK